MEPVESINLEELVEKCIVSLKEEKEILEWLQGKANKIRYTLILWNYDDECPYKLTSWDKDYTVFCRDLAIVEEEINKKWNQLKV